ncbi:MerR family transcripitonal regulator [Knoellia sinensis KCTC 19936]|uniref:MerR family transcripitonal regulator n=1 Tax=Knoellia sinensis KCTC 19936 TaxID=1385520 RepID=A0A0A0J864_9MICO|nr:MerR family transcriptional regulator [Knoellia sinensis]KGN33358.1 MerR family transcripitonal regulator [Knoellia sinensis KCTC 19936]
MPPSRPERPLTIGKVLDALREEFPEVSISKIRFLEAEGLVAPARTPAGYRTYAVGDVERLRYILRAQRDRFWPLKVIRESLDALDRGLTPGSDVDGRPRPPEPTGDPDVPDASALRPERPERAVRLTRAELAAATGLDPDVISALQGFGLLRPDDSGHFSTADLQAADAAAGLTAYGIEARHLRPFRTAADREVGLVEQAVSTRRAVSRTQEQAEVARLCLQLHAALVKGGLARP